jgi:hypothetical protein
LQDIVEQFKKDGFNAELKFLKDFEDDYGLRYGLNDDDDDDGDDDCYDDEDHDEDSGDGVSETSNDL